MKIAIDIDDVVLATTEKIISILEDKYNILVNMDDINVYDIAESTGVDPKLIPIIVNEAINSEYISPMVGAVATINWLGHYFEPIHFISNRYLYQPTLDQIQQLELDVEYKIHLCKEATNGIPDKAKLINELGIDIIIEDKAETIVDIYNKTNATILIFNRPWNTSFEVDNIRTFRVKTWLIDIIYWFSARIPQLLAVGMNCRLSFK